jgi:hypothetical protein
LTDFLTIVAIVLVAVSAMATSSLKPLIIQVFVHSAGFNRATAGYLLTTELLSTSIGTIIVTAFPFAFLGRRWLIVALCLSLLGNVLSISFNSRAETALYGLRCMAGLGSGFALGRLGIAIALSKFPGRIAGLNLVSTLLFGATAAFAIPAVQRVIGGGAVFALLAITIPPAIVLVRFLPGNHHRNGVASKAVVDPRSDVLGAAEKLIVIASISVFYLGVGLFWPFVSILGETAHIGSAQITSILGWAAFSGMLGALTAVLAGDHKGSAALITLVLIALCASVALQLIFPYSVYAFVTSVLLFAYAYFTTAPMIQALMSRIDVSGQMNGVYFFVSVCCLALGPAIAGWLMANPVGTSSGPRLLKTISLTLLASSSMVQIYFAHSAKRRRKGSGQ